MTTKERDELYDVVWSGEEGLIPDRESKPGDLWTAPSRQYHFTGKHKGKGKRKTDTTVVIVEGDPNDDERTEQV